MQTLSTQDTFVRIYLIPFQVYKNWITPLKNQLSEMRFQLHRFMDNSVPEHWENKGQSTSSTNCCTSGDSTVATTETSILSDHSLPDPEHSQTGVPFFKYMVEDL